MNEHYGIDLGTRNTAVECKSGRLSAAKGGTIPSAVAYDLLSGNIRIGDGAMAVLQSMNAQERARWSVATSFKTALESDRGFAESPGGTKTAQSVLEDYFRGLAELAREQCLPPLRSAVFSIPVGFGARSRTRLLDAAKRAGIEAIGIVSESTAAYLKIVHSLGAAERVAVVDWGAGTLDVSVLRISGGVGGCVIEEQACLGSTTAGDKIDMSIYEFLAARARADGRTIGPVDQVAPELMRTVLRACERAKLSLSDSSNPRSSTDLVLLAFTDGKGAKFELTAANLRALAKHACDNAFRVLEESVETAGLSIGQLDRIIFVGGCTGILGFSEAARERYGQAVVFPASPEWVVAGGALEVASGDASYESLQEFGCVLDDGHFLPLTHGSQFDGAESHVTVAATESTRVASIVLAERQSDRTTLAGTLSVPLQGHLGEPVQIRTVLRRDLSVGVDAWSRCADAERDIRSLNITNTRFRFRVH